MADNRRNFAEVDPELQAFIKRAMENKLTPAESQSAPIASAYASQYPGSIYGNQFAVIRLECSNGTALGSGVFPKAIQDKGIGKACDGALVVSADETMHNWNTLSLRDPKHLLAPFLEKAMAAGTISVEDANNPAKKNEQVVAAYQMANKITQIGMGASDTHEPRRCVAKNSCEPVVPGKTYSKDQLLINQGLGLEAAFTANVLTPFLTGGKAYALSSPALTGLHEPTSRSCRTSARDTSVSNCVVNGLGLGSEFRHRDTRSR